MLSGKDRHVILLVISLLIASSVYGQAGKIYKYHFDGGLQSGNVIAGNQRQLSEFNTSGAQDLIINYSISELNIESIINSSGEFFKISIPGHNPTSEPGKPELPVLSRLISVPENCTFNIKISDLTSEKIVPSIKSFNGLLYPKQAGATKDFQQQRSGFLLDKTEYSKRGIINSDTVKIEYIGKVRNRQLASVLIYPVRYNPYTNDIEVIKSMKIEITFSQEKGSVISSKGSSLLFNQSIDKGVLNYNPSDVITGYSDQPVKMVIITDPSFRKYLEPFYKWKTQKGFRLKILYKGTGLAGNTYAQLKDTLTKIYNSATVIDPAPEYLLIIGDVNRIPRSEGTNNISDMYYGEFDGNGDYIPDMYIGRLPVTDTTELKTVIGKIMQYEKFEFADTNKFYSRALVTAGNDGGYANYMNGQVKYAVSNYLNSTNKISGYHFYYPQSYSADDSIKKLINNGLSFINYTGHGDALGWLDPAIRSTDVPVFTNKNMYPFVISNACRTAQFNTPGSFGNTMVVSADKGAVGYIGCSNDSYWDEDYYWAVGVGSPNADPKYAETGLGALDRLFHTHSELPSDWYLSMGQVNYAGNLAVSESTSSKKKYYWETYTLLGDPSTIPFIGTPDSFNIVLPDTLPNGIRSLSMTIPPFAYMAVSHFDTLWDASYASPSGSVILDMPGLSNDSCLVVISGQNKVPIIKTIHFAETDHEFINLTSSSLNDASSDNNGRADYGESLFIKIIVSNLGMMKATGLYAKLTTTSTWATITKDSVFIGTLNGKSQITLPSAFGITIADLVPDKGYITMNLLLRDSLTVKNYTIDICIHSPVLEILNCLIDDSGTGNNNYFAEPGETFNLLFKVRNSGSSNISGTFKIENQPAGVIIYHPLVSTGPLLFGETAIIPVSVKLAADFARGGTFDIATLLDCSPYFKNKTFTIPVGKTKESFEYQKLTIFPWVNSATYPWVITGGQAFDGQYSATSGVISHSTESLLKLKVNVPVKDTIRFNVKVSSEINYDYLYFRLNGTQMFGISGETDWIEKKFALQEGFNLLEWYYRKDQSVSSGADCGWLDNIRFPSAAYNNRDLKTGKIVTPQPNKNYTQEQITAEVINLGTDTVKSFNLAYQVNSNPVIAQNFIRKINPADTAIVTFNQSADLTGNGTYIIKVYGLNNSDNFLMNDTTILTIVNTAIFTPVENPANKVKISPNPFRQSFRLDIDSKRDDVIRISLFGQSGKLLWEEQQIIVPGSNSFTLSPENIPTGFYTLRITGKSTLKAARIVKIE
jgi:hypothetical protein